MTDQLSNDLASLRISQADRVQRGGGRRLVVVGAAVAAIGGAVAFVAPGARARFARAEIETTEVARVVPTQGVVELTATGYVVPQVTAHVGAKIVGRVAKVEIREGQRVEAGAPMFELDAADQKSQVAAAQARAASARARAEAARANVAEIQQQLARQRKLVEGGAAGQATVDDLAARVHALEVAARAADADAQAESAEVESLRVGLKNTLIAAPIGGTVVGKPAQVGDVVGPISGGGVGQLVDLVDFGSLLVEVDVPEARLGQVRPGAPCEVVLDAFADRRLRGSVVEVAPRLNRAKATATVKVKIDDAFDAVLPEMSARIGFLAKPLGDAELNQAPRTIVPASAVVDRAGGKVVFVVEGDHVRMQPVVLGGPGAGGFELKQGPAPGARLVKDPPPDLADGAGVKQKGEGS